MLYPTDELLGENKLFFCSMKSESSFVSKLQYVRYARVKAFGVSSGGLGVSFSLYRYRIVDETKGEFQYRTVGAVPVLYARVLWYSTGTVHVTCYHTTWYCTPKKRGERSRRKKKEIHSPPFTPVTFHHQLVDAL